MAWNNLRLAPGSFKLTCGTPGVDHLTFQPAPVPGIVLQSLMLCPTSGPGQWESEDLPEPSCHGCVALCNMCMCQLLKPPHLLP